MCVCVLIIKANGCNGDKEIQMTEKREVTSVVKEKLVGEDRNFRPGNKALFEREGRGSRGGREGGRPIGSGRLSCRCLFRRFR